MTGEWRVKLIPRKWAGHKQLHGLMPKFEYYENNDLVVARFTHLVELSLKRSYIPSTDYKALFMKEFRNRIDKVGGNDINIWEEVQDDRLEE